MAAPAAVVVATAQTQAGLADVRSFTAPEMAVMAARQVPLELPVESCGLPCWLGTQAAAAEGTRAAEPQALAALAVLDAAAAAVAESTDRLPGKVAQAATVATARCA